MNNITTPSSPYYSLDVVAERLGTACDVLQRIALALEAHPPRRGYDPNVPARVFTARAERIADHLRRLPAGTPIPTRELVRQLAIPAKSFENPYFRRRVEAAGVVRIMRDGRNFWTLAEQRRAAQ